MGTSGAFGGSKTAAWGEVADFIGELENEPTSTDGEPDVADEDVEADRPDEESDTGKLTPAQTLAQLVAQALQSDDPALRPKNAPVTQSGDSGLGMGGLLGNPRLRGTTRLPSGSGRRQIVASTGRAGRAVGAGYALAAGNAAALADYGLDLVALQGMGKIDQIFVIMDAVGIGNSGPDDRALRLALYGLLNRIVDDSTTSPIETLRDLVCEYATQLFAIELDALVQDGKLPPASREGVLNDLSGVIKVDAAHLNLEQAVVGTAEQFEHAAQQLMRATLAIVRAGETK